MSDRGSPKEVAASGNVTPCLFAFHSAFSGSQANLSIQRPTGANDRRRSSVRVSVEAAEEGGGSGGIRRLALLNPGLRSALGFVLTPRDFDLEPGTWTDAHRSRVIFSPKTARVKELAAGLRRAMPFHQAHAEPAPTCGRELLLAF